MKERREERRGKDLGMRFRRVFGMEVGEEERRVGEVRGRFPRGSIGVVEVAFPFDEILDLLVSKPRVEDRRDFPFDVIDDFDWFGGIFVSG